MFVPPGVDPGPRSPRVVAKNHPAQVRKVPLKFGPNPMSGSDGHKEHIYIHHPYENYSRIRHKLSIIIKDFFRLIYFNNSNHK